MKGIVAPELGKFNAVLVPPTPFLNTTRLPEVRQSASAPFEPEAVSLYKETVFCAWDDWNIDHIGRHGVRRAEAEQVVWNAHAPWPEEKGDDKLLVWGSTDAGRLLQVIFVLNSPGRAPVRVADH